MSYKLLPPTPHTVSSVASTPGSRRRARSVTPGSTPGTPSGRTTPRAPRPHSDLFTSPCGLRARARVGAGAPTPAPFSHRAHHPKPAGLMLSNTSAPAHSDETAAPTSTESFFTAEGGMTPAATAATFILPPLPPGCPVPRRTPPRRRDEVWSCIDSSPSVYGPTPSASAASLASMSFGDDTFSSSATVTHTPARGSLGTTADLSPLSTRAAAACAIDARDGGPTQPSTPVKARPPPRSRKHPNGRSWTMPVHSTPPGRGHLSGTPKVAPLTATRSLPVARLPGTPPPKKAALRRQRANTTRSETRAVPLKRRWPKILALPTEVLIHIAKNVVAADPWSLAQLAATCRRLHNAFQSDDVLLPLIRYQLGFLAAAGRALCSQLTQAAAGDATLGNIGLLMLNAGYDSDAHDADCKACDVYNTFNPGDVSDAASDASGATMRGPLDAGTTPWSTPLGTTPPLFTFSPADSCTPPDNHDSHDDDLASYYFRPADSDEECETLFEELLSETETPDHRIRCRVSSRVMWLCHLLLKVYHNTALGQQGNLPALSDMYASSEFEDALDLMATRVIPHKLLSAARTLCHLQALFLRPADAPLWSEHNRRPLVSRRYRHLDMFSTTPLVDLSGRVVWEEVLPLQVYMLSFADWLLETTPRRYFMQAAEGVAQPQLGMPKAVSHEDDDTDWIGIGGVWYGLLPSRGVDDSILLEHINLTPCSPAALALEIASHDSLDPKAITAPGELKQTPLHTNLPWNDSVPPLYFHGDTACPAAAPYCVRGVARLTTDCPPEIRIKMVVRKHGHDIVRFDGVYVGGAGSQRGIVGVGVGLAEEAHAEQETEHIPAAKPGWFVKASP